MAAHETRAGSSASICSTGDGAVCIKVHPRMPPGGARLRPRRLPGGEDRQALRDVESLARWAERHGDAVGQFARALLAGELPWTRMRPRYLRPVTHYALPRPVREEGDPA